MRKPIRYSKRFKKNYKELVRARRNLKVRVEERVEMFLKDPSYPILRSHPLLGDLIGMYSFSITGDIRIVYFERHDYYDYYDIGTHAQVY